VLFTGISITLVLWVWNPVAFDNAHFSRQEVLRQILAFQVTTMMFIGFHLWCGIRTWKGTDTTFEFTQANEVNGAAFQLRGVCFGQDLPVVELEFACVRMPRKTPSWFRGVAADAVMLCVATSLHQIAARIRGACAKETGLYKVWIGKSGIRGGAATLTAWCLTLRDGSRLDVGTSAQEGNPAWRFKTTWEGDRLLVALIPVSVPALSARNPEGYARVTTALAWAFATMKGTTLRI
jgi:hypothetical protein